MNKNSIIYNETNYLNLPEVSDFVDWLRKLSSQSDDESFPHSYEIEAKRRKKTKERWSCNNLYEAFEKYEWSFSFIDVYKNKNITGNTYRDSEEQLNYLKGLLLAGVKKNDNVQCLNSCIMILKWGGVLGGDEIGNKKKINEMSEDISCYLKSVKEYFDNDPVLTSRYSVKVKGKECPIIMNAGFTKIYSLLCGDFIIYDGRVGAALGLLVRTYLTGKSIEKIPGSLDFRYGRARNSKVNRNPSTEKYEFKPLGSSDPVHIRNNLKANWIIKSIDLSSAEGFKQQSNPARAFESALFMLGYRI